MSILYMKTRKYRAAISGHAANKWKGCLLPESMDITTVASCFIDYSTTNLRNALYDLDSARKVSSIFIPETRFF